VRKLQQINGGLAFMSDLEFFQFFKF